MRFDISIELGHPNSILMFFYITVQRDGHAELVSASHCEPLLVLLRGQILKQVQDDICVLTAHRSQLITQNLCHQRAIENSLQNCIFV